MESPDNQPHHPHSSGDVNEVIYLAVLHLWHRQIAAPEEENSKRKRGRSLSRPLYSTKISIYRNLFPPARAIHSLLFPKTQCFFTSLDYYTISNLNERKEFRNLLVRNSYNFAGDITLSTYRYSNIMLS